MFRATGYRRSLLQWDRLRHLRPAGTTFAQRPIRLAAATAVAGLLLGNAALVYQVATGLDAGPVRQKSTSGQAGYQPEAIDLRSALETVEAKIRADVGRLTVQYRETSGRRSRPEGPRDLERDRIGSQPDGGATASMSTTAGSSGGSNGFSSTESHTATGSGGSSGDSSGGDTSNDSTSGSSGGSSSGSGTGGTTSGGAGGGGGGDVSGGSVTGGGSGGGGGG
jgi:hypothetical protein